MSDATTHEHMRLTHVLSDAEMEVVNRVLRQHRVAEFAEPVIVADLLRRVRHFDNEPREHVLRELERVLGVDDGGPDES